MALQACDTSLIADGYSENPATTPEVALKSKAALDSNTTAAPSDISPTTQFKVDETTLSNATAAESDLSDTNNPKS